MIDKIKKAIQDVGGTLRDQANQFGEGAKEKTYELIEEWLAIFPKLEIYGLEITSFALGVGINPSLEVELRGKHEDFPKERIQEIIDENKGSTGIVSVFTTIRTTYGMHRRIYASLKDPLIVKIKIQLLPEIKVFIGEPLIM